MSNFFDKSISIVLPAYNEQAVIVETVREIDAYVKNTFEDYEILVVSEGSTDNTVSVAQSLQRDIPELIVLEKKEWTGMAGAVRTGFRHATKDLVFYTDADRQFDIHELDLLLPMIARYDMVIGYKLKRNDPLIRRCTSWLYNKTMRLLFGIRVRDINCAFKLFRRQVIQSVDFLPNLTEGIINAEIFLSAEKHGHTIGQVGVHHYPRRTGSPISELRLFPKMVFVNPRVVYRFLKDTIRLLQKIYL